MLKKYFRRIETYSNVRFILEVTALAFVSRFLLTLPVAIILALIGFQLGDPNITMFDLKHDLIPVSLYLIVIAPFMETLLFQLLPIKVLDLFFPRAYYLLKIAVVTLIFAYAHLNEGLINFIGMLPIGFLFVWSFTVKQKQSVRLAVLSVFIIHALTNLLATLMYFL